MSLTHRTCLSTFNLLMISLFLSGGPVVHRSDYTYRGGYHYHYQPPRIPPPVVYRPIPLSPPVTHYRPSVPVSPYHPGFTGPHHMYRGLSPPVAHRPHQGVKGPFHNKLKGPCPTVWHPAVLTAPVVQPPTVQPEQTVAPAVPPTTVAPLVLVTSAAVALPVSTQSGFITTVSPVKTGRISPVRFDFQVLASFQLMCFFLFCFALTNDDDDDTKDVTPQKQNYYY